MVRFAGKTMILDEFFVCVPYKDKQYECYFQCSTFGLSILSSCVYQVEPTFNKEVVNVRVLCDAADILALSQMVKKCHVFSPWVYPGIIPFPEVDTKDD